MAFIQGKRRLQARRGEGSFSRAEKFSREYGEDSVLEVIYESMANGYKGIFSTGARGFKEVALSAKTQPEVEKSFDTEDSFDRALRRSYAVMEKAAKEGSGNGRTNTGTRGRGFQERFSVAQFHCNFHSGIY